jgi:hypothetical protein
MHPRARCAAAHPCGDRGRGERLLAPARGCFEAAAPSLSNLVADLVAGRAGPFLDAPAGMLSDPFLGFDLALPGTVEWKLQGRALIGCHVEPDFLADVRRVDEAGG